MQKDLKQQRSKNANKNRDDSSSSSRIFPSIPLRLELSKGR